MEQQALAVSCSPHRHSELDLPCVDAQIDQQIIGDDLPVFIAETYALVDTNGFTGLVVHSTVRAQSTFAIVKLYIAFQNGQVGVRNIDTICIDQDVTVGVYWVGQDARPIR